MAIQIYDDTLNLIAGCLNLQGKQTLLTLGQGFVVSPVSFMHVRLADGDKLQVTLKTHFPNE